MTSRTSELPTSVTDVLQQLDASQSLDRLYNALVVVRTRYSKGNDAIVRLRHHGGKYSFYLVTVFKL